MRIKQATLALPDRCRSCGAMKPTDQDGYCQGCALGDLLPPTTARVVRDLTTPQDRVRVAMGLDNLHTQRT